MHTGANPYQGIQKTDVALYKFDKSKAKVILLVYNNYYYHVICSGTPLSLHSHNLLYLISPFGQKPDVLTVPFSY